jgi:hypothetical protein
MLYRKSVIALTSQFRQAATIIQLTEFLLDWESIR